MKTFKSIVILFPFALVLSSCGSGGGSKKEEKMNRWQSDDPPTGFIIRRVK